ncbi:MAG: hypothetical protein A2147_00110 [Chloroflexi bacterium RBG_16_57_8]|nr:MAG: hypothetical protein A2147_00110 [Chloroflexi bacterium RBG_16_57_8]
MRAGEISSADRAALAEVRKRGIHVSLCTGRAQITGRLIVDDLGLDGYHMFFDGGLVSNPHTGEIVYSRPLSPEVVRRAVEFAHRNRIILDLFSETGYFAEQENWVTEIRRDYFGIVPTILDFDHLPAAEKVIKGTLVVRSPEEKAGAERFRQHFDGDLTLSRTVTPAFPDVDFLNVVAPGVSKRGALEALVAHLGISLDQVMAIGDGVNDMPIISAAGLGVAMGNAPDKVKAIADYVTLDADHSGVAAAVRRSLLEDK